MNEYRLTEQIGHILRRAHQRHVAVFAEEFAEFEMTPMQFAVLVTTEREGEASQNHLGRLTGMDPATVQGVVLRLAARSLLSARDDPQDGRRRAWRLTDDGRELLERCMPVARRVSLQTLSPLSKNESDRLMALLEKIT